MKYLNQVSMILHYCWQKKKISQCNSQWHRRWTITLLYLLYYHSYSYATCKSTEELQLHIPPYLLPSLTPLRRSKGDCHFQGYKMAT